MNAMKWVLFTLYGLSILSTVLAIGKPRKPITPELAAAQAVVAAIMMTLVALA